MAIRYEDLTLEAKEKLKQQGYKPKLDIAEEEAEDIIEKHERVPRKVYKSITEAPENIKNIISKINKKNINKVIVEGTEKGLSATSKGASRIHQDVKKHGEATRKTEQMYRNIYEKAYSDAVKTHIRQVARKRTALAGGFRLRTPTEAMKEARIYKNLIKKLARKQATAPRYIERTRRQIPSIPVMTRENPFGAPSPFDADNPFFRRRKKLKSDDFMGLGGWYGL